MNEQVSQNRTWDMLNRQSKLRKYVDGLMSTQQRRRQGGFPLPNPGLLKPWRAARSMRALWTHTCHAGKDSDKEPEIKRPGQWGKPTSQSQKQTQSKEKSPKPQGTGSLTKPLQRDNGHVREMVTSHPLASRNLGREQQHLAWGEGARRRLRILMQLFFFSWWDAFLPPLWQMCFII